MVFLRIFQTYPQLIKIWNQERDNDIVELHNKFHNMKLNIQYIEIGVTAKCDQKTQTKYKTKYINCI